MILGTYCTSIQSPYSTHRRSLPTRYWYPIGCCFRVLKVFACTLILIPHIYCLLLLDLRFTLSASARVLIALRTFHFLADALFCFLSFDCFCENYSFLCFVPFAFRLTVSSIEIVSRPDSCVSFVLLCFLRSQLHAPMNGPVPPSLAARSLPGAHQRRTAASRRHARARAGPLFCM